MTKADAHAEVLRRWRARPIMQRLDHKQAIGFALELSREIEFETLGNPHKVIEAWLIRELNGYVPPTRRSAESADSRPHNL